jgi:ABC-type branched-subunit amino acid transport system substrate-binding protein
MQSRKLLAGAAVLVSFSFLASGCGDDKSSDTTTTTKASGASGATTTTKKEVSCPTSGKSDGMLKFGALLPETGTLAPLGPPEIAGGKLAVKEINEAGGVLGKDVEWLPGDSGDASTDTASQTVEKHLNAGVDAIVGAASSAVTGTVIDKIVGAGVIQYSPANTAKTLSTREDCDLYFRNAPSDVLQGQVLADIVTEQGYNEVAVLALQDPYGEGLAEDFETNFKASGGKITLTKIYDPNASNYDAEVQAVVDSNPKALVLIAFSEGTKIITALTEKGKAPTKFPIFMTDGYTDPGSAKDLKAGTLEGIQGTVPEADPSKGDQTFITRLNAFDPALNGSTSYAGESYDAVVVTSLAATKAGTDDPLKIAAEIPGITREGTKCTAFKACVDLIKAGTDIDYDGPSGPIDMDKEGDPTKASYALKKWTADNKLDVVKYIPAEAAG